MKKKMINLSPLEKELLLLLSSVQIFDSIVNHEILSINVDENKIATIRPKSYTAMKYFFIYSLDFFSTATDLLNYQENKNYLELLKELPQYSALLKNSASMLGNITELERWINKELIYENFYFSTFNYEVDLKVKRLDVLKINANFSKHNWTRLNACRKDLKNILLKNDLIKNNTDLIEDRNLFYTIDNFCDFFIGDNQMIDKYLYCLAYHFNNIRLSIKYSLMPVYYDSIEYFYEKDGIRRYRFKRQNDMSEFEYYLFFDLMNWVGSKSIFEKFDIMKCWKE
jgi:hypothetical protein